MSEAPVTRYDFYTAGIFTDRIFGGNPLAVFPDARGLDDQQMQQIAREFNLSETTFVLPSDDPGHTCRVRIFTPAAEVPFAGHPTLGTAFVLAVTGRVALTGGMTDLVLEEGVGPVPVKVMTQAGAPTFVQLSAAQMPQVGPAPPPAASLAQALSLQPEDILTGELAPEAVSCGLPFLFVPVRDRAAVGRAEPELAAWRRVLGDYWAAGVFVFAMEPERGDADLRARMFAPTLGVWEDPATGSAAAALAGYLGRRHPLRDGTLSWVVEQGVEMGRPSILHVQADKRAGAIVAVRVGGACVLVSQGTFLGLT